MITILGVMLIWCLLIAWVARIAQGRGRSVIGWTAGAGAASVLGVAAGIAVFVRVVNRSVFSSGDNDLTLVAALLPLFALVAPIVVIGVVLQRAPIRVVLRKSWPVHLMDRGPGRVLFDDAGTCFEWSNGSLRLTRQAVRSVVADGECVRVTCTVDDDVLELVVLPMGKPETPAGRRQQSLALAGRLRGVAGT